MIAADTPDAARRVEKRFPWLKTVNPYYKTGTKYTRAGFETNCVLAAITVDISIAEGEGFITVPTTAATTLDDLINNTGNQPLNTDFPTIDTILTTAPPGARAHIAYNTTPKTGHVITATKETDGTIYYLDGQTGGPAQRPTTATNIKLIPINFTPTTEPNTNHSTEPKTGPGQNSTTQYAGNRSSKALGTGSHGLAGLLINKGAAAREQALAEKYDLKVGPMPESASEHFSHSMLDRIEKVLGELPADHVTANPKLRAIVRAAATSGAASEYDPETNSIRLVKPPGIPSWLYAKINRGIGWQQYLMDVGAKLDLSGLSLKDQLSPRRNVMGGESDVLAHGNLVKWTLRHEIGHSVEELINGESIDWDNLASEEQFGGWQTHSEQEGLRIAANALLTKAGVTRAEMQQEIASTGLLHAFSLAIEPNRPSAPRAKVLDSIADIFASANPVLHAKITNAADLAKMALAQPWTLKDGGATALGIESRIYQVDDTDNTAVWVSYNAAARDNAVSNYQFSNRKEWFAEAYAAFYDTKPEPKAQLSTEVRNFFTKRLPSLVANARARQRRSVSRLSCGAETMRFTWLPSCRCAARSMPVTAPGRRSGGAR